MAFISALSLLAARLFTFKVSALVSLPLLLPLELVWKVSLRDREIFNEFNGKNHHDLARKFGVSIQWIYSVVKRIRKEELDRLQGKLFDNESE